jgi:hypothetical protein
MECINISVFGDTIYVANGTYKEQVVMIPGLSLIGAGMDSCVIDTREFTAPIGFQAIEVADSCLVMGFYILVSNDFNYGYGILCTGQTGLVTLNKISSANTGIYLFDTEIEVYHNFLLDNRSGIDIVNSNSLIRKNFISNEIEQNGPGIVIDAFNSNYFPVIDSNFIENAYFGIHVSFGTKPTITNNTIILKGEYASGIVISGNSDTVKIFNNSIIGENGWAGIRTDLIQILIRDNQLTGNFNTSFNEFPIIAVYPNNELRNNSVTNTNKTGIEAENNPSPKIHYNDSWNNETNFLNFTPDSTNLSVDPMIASEDSNDFHLQKYSPLIDKGDPNILDVDGTRSDIGLYGGPYGEQYHYVDLAPRTPVNLNATLDSLTVGITWNKNTEADFNHYNVYRDTTKNFEIDSTNLFVSTPVANLIDILPDYVEKIYYKITAVDNQDNESEPSEEVGFILTSITDHQQTISDYRLYQNYPNPFNPSTKINYRLKERGYVKLYVYDIKGELVSVLVNQTQEAGFYEVEFNSEVRNNLSSGIYIYQIMVRNENNIPVFTDMKKMILVK